MPVTINGDGSITGLVAGGLPAVAVVPADGSITSAKLADDAVTSEKITGNTFVSYALLADRHGATAGDRGTFSSGGWRTREINTEVVDTDNIVTLSSNQFTLQAGTYQIKFGACAYKVNRHITRLRQISPLSTIAAGSSQYSYASGADLSWSRGFARLTISQATAYEIQHYCQTTQSSNGFGFQMTYSTSDYVQVEIYKEAS